MDQRKFSIGDRIRVSGTYWHPHICGKVGTIVGHPVITMGATPAVCFWVEFDEPGYAHQSTGGAVKIDGMELLSLSDDP
jgi:hypothetical protein